MTWRMLAITVATVLIAAADKAYGIVQYSVTDLGTLGGISSHAYGINNSGQVVGNALTAGGDVHAFLYTGNGPMQDLNDLIAPDSGLALLSARGINNLGQVAGSAQTSDGWARAFLYGSGVARNLGTPSGSDYDLSYGSAINAGGQVVGRSYGLAGPEYAFLYSSGMMTDLGGLGGMLSHANAVNDSGQVVGEASLDYRTPIHAFRTAPNQPVNPATDDLGTLGGTTSEAWGINDGGQVVGWSHTSAGAIHAFRTAPNQPINPATDDLGTLGGTTSRAYGINKSGQVVGEASIPGGGTHAFLYTGNGPMQDLNDLIAPVPGFRITEARGINDLGQIACTGFIGMHTHAFRLDPIVPEPSSLVLLSVAGLGLLAPAVLMIRKHLRLRPCRHGFRSSCAAL
jgi:probable HAF family extracellular repeat protein